LLLLNLKKPSKLKSQRKVRSFLRLTRKNTTNFLERCYSECYKSVWQRKTATQAQFLIVSRATSGIMKNLRSN